MGATDDVAMGAGADGPDGPSPVDWAVADVREQTDARGLIETVMERRGRLDILVNNAGGQYFTSAEGIALKGWRAVWRLNVEGMLNMSEAAVTQGLGGPGATATPPIREAAEAMAGVARVGGVIVNVTLTPHHGMPDMARRADGGDGRGADGGASGGGAGLRAGCAGRRWLSEGTPRRRAS